MESKEVRIPLPENCEVGDVKATVEDNFIVVEYTPKEKFKPKNGDIVYIKSELWEWIIIFKDISHGGICRYCGVSLDDMGLWVDGDYTCYESYIDEIRLATQKERDILFNVIKEHGLHWNSEEKKLEKIRWRAKNGESYYYVDSMGGIRLLGDTRNPMNNKHWDIGNYFETEECIIYAEKIKELLLNR